MPATKPEYFHDEQGVLVLAAEIEQMVEGVLVALANIAVRRGLRIIHDYLIPWISVQDVGLQGMGHPEARVAQPLRLPTPR